LVTHNLLLFEIKGHPLLLHQINFWVSKFWYYGDLHQGTSKPAPTFRLHRQFSHPLGKMPHKGDKMRSEPRGVLKICTAYFIDFVSFEQEDQQTQPQNHKSSLMLRALDLQD